MLNRRPKTKTSLDELIDTVHAELEGYHATDSEFATITERLTDLYKIRTASEPKDHLSKETMLTVAANLTGILLILNHERLNVVTSKALALVIKPRL